MAEYYPLLAKAVGSLPNSTSDTRRVVYERARKALIGQLRTLHPPVPDEDIEHESIELDRAIQRLEAELAAAPPKPATQAVPPASAAPASATLASPTPAQPAPTGQAPQMPAPPRPAVASQAQGGVAPTRPAPRAPVNPGGGLGPPEKSFPALRTKLPAAKPLPPILTPPATSPTAAITPAVAPAAAPAAMPQAAVPASAVAALSPEVDTLRQPGADNGTKAPAEKPRLEVQRPIAPQPPAPKGPQRRMWIIPAGIFVVALVAFAAWKLRDRPQTLARVKPTEQTSGDQGKIAERIGGPAAPSAGALSPSPVGPSSAGPSPTQPSSAKPSSAESPTSSPSTPATPPDTQPEAKAPAATQTPGAAPADQPAATNADLPVAHRAALLVEAPEESSKVKTFLGNVTWKLNTINDGPNEAASLAVEANIDLPDDNMKAVVTFEKNSDPSLPASHTIKIRFYVQPGSATGDVKQISVPQVRNENSPSGEGLAGVTVPVMQNSFLVGLSPGATEATNMELLKSQQWIDIPMLLTSGKIAKLTFEKSESGQRDLTEAITAWQKS